MATREKYNTCMKPYIRGSNKTKEQRQMNFCIGAKVCSGKAKNEEEAKKLCLLPKEPKPVKVKRGKKASDTNYCDTGQFFEIASQFKNLYIDVNSQRCQPCQALNVLIREAEIPFQIVQVPEECLDIIDQLGVESFPTVVKMSKGKIVARHDRSPEEIIEKMKLGL